jgi:hypothetical protein
MEVLPKRKVICQKYVCMRRKNYLGSQERQELTYCKEKGAADFSVLKLRVFHYRQEDAL